jgi:stage II sporulation protein M
MDEEKLPVAQPDVPAPRRLPGVLKDLYREEGEAWRAHYRTYFKYAARALGLGFVLGFLYFWLWPAQEKRALAFVIQALKDIPLDAGPALMALTLFYHNARASVVAIAAGAVPFLFLPIFDPLLNGAVLGLLVSIARHQRLDVPRLVLTQILPHGVFELTAVLYATTLGLYLSAGLGEKAKAAWRRRKEKTGSLTSNRTSSDIRSDRSGPQGASAAGAAVPEGMPERDLQGGTAAPEPEPESPCQAGLLRDVVRSFVLVVMPLLLIAALVEAFITPHLR